MATPKGVFRIVDVNGTEILNLCGVQTYITALTAAGMTTPEAQYQQVGQGAHVAFMLEYFDHGFPTRDETWIHPAGGPSYMGRFIDRPVQAELCIHIIPQGLGSNADLASKGHHLIKSAVRAVRNQFEFAMGYFEHGQSSTEWTRFRFYPSAVPSPLQPEQLYGSLVTAQYRVLDWVIPIWHDPYPVAASDSGDTAAGDVDHLPML